MAGQFWSGPKRRGEVGALWKGEAVEARQGLV